MTANLEINQIMPQETVLCKETKTINSDENLNFKAVLRKKWKL